MADKFYLDTKALEQYLKYLSDMKSRMFDTVQKGKDASEAVINFSDNVIISACEHVDNICENIKKMGAAMDNMSETAVKLHRLYVQYNERIK